METTNFHSEHIKYDDINHQLYVRFTSGEYFVYYDVLPIDYVGFLSADDHSQYVVNRLNDKYDMRKLR